MRKRLIIPVSTALVGLLAASCSAVSARTQRPVDCSAGAQYELSIKRDFESDAPWFGSGDSTGAKSAPAQQPSQCMGGTASTVASNPIPGHVADATAEPIPGGRCGSQQALVLRSAGHTDWGSIFGDYSVTTQPWEGGGYEGLALWARHDGGDSTVTIQLDTWQTSNNGSQPGDEVCEPDCNQHTGTVLLDPSGNVLSQSYVSPPGTCGNSFKRLLTVTESWQLYLLPFSSFYQELAPNMSPSGMDPRHINGLTIQVPKEALLELWIDDIALYKRK
jgi:hypothetical protein